MVAKHGFTYKQLAKIMQTRFLKSKFVTELFEISKNTIIKFNFKTFAAKKGLISVIQREMKKKKVDVTSTARSDVPSAEGKKRSSKKSNKEDEKSDEEEQLESKERKKKEQAGNLIQTWPNFLN